MGSTIHQIYDAEVAVAVNSSGYEKSARKVANSTKQLTNRLKLRANINQPVRALGKLNTKVKSTTRSIVRSLTSLVAAGGLIAFAKQSVEVGRNLNAMRSLSKQVFPSMQDDLEKWAQAAGSTYALSERMALKYASQLGAMAEAMGFSEKEAYQMSTTLTGLAGDVASFYSITQDEAYTKLRSVFSGESEPLKDLGVVMTQTNLDAYALSHGFNKTTKEMTQTELATLRYQYVLYSLSNAQGDVLRTSQSFGVKLRFIKLNFENLMATIGQGIINILLPLMDVLNKIIARLQVVANAFRAWTERFKQVSPAAKFIKGLGGADKSAKKLGDTAGGASDNADALGDSLEGAGDDAKKAAKKMKQAQRDIMGFDQINKITKQQESEGTSGGSGTTTGVSFSMDDIVPSDSEVDKSADNFAKKFLNSLKGSKYWEKVGSAIADKVASALGKIPWTKIQTKTKAIAEKIAGFLNGFLGSQNMWSKTGQTVAEAINTALIGANTFFATLKWDKIGKAIATGFNNFMKKMDWSLAAETLSNLAKGILDFFSSAISEVAWDEVGADIVEYLTGIDWSGVFTRSVNLVASIAEGFFDLLTGAFEKAVDKIAEEGAFQSYLDLKKKEGLAILEFVLRIKLAWDKSVQRTTKNIMRMLGFDIPDEVDLDLSAVQQAAMTSSITVPVKGILDALDQTKLTDAQKTIGGATATITKASAKKGYVPSVESTANFTSRLNNLPDDKKKFATVANFKSRVNNLSDSEKKFASVANFTSRSLALTTAQTTIETTARITNITFSKSAQQVMLAAFGYGKAEGGMYKNGGWKPITAAAGGGQFSGGQLFIAREAGPELVGRMPGGGTGVINNAQIVDSVSAGVYKAVVAAMGNGDKAVNVYLQGDAGKFFKAMQYEATQYTNATGMAAFPA